MVEAILDGATGFWGAELGGFSGFFGGPIAASTVGEKIPEAFPRTRHGPRGFQSLDDRIRGFWGWARRRSSSGRTAAPGASGTGEPQAPQHLPWKSRWPRMWGNGRPLSTSPLARYPRPSLHRSLFLRLRRRPKNTPRGNQRIAPTATRLEGRCRTSGEMGSIVISNPLSSREVAE